MITPEEKNIRQEGQQSSLVVDLSANQEHSAGSTGWEVLAFAERVIPRVTP